MSDFIADLESELRDAARRRATRRRRHAVPMRAVLAVAASVATLALAVGAVRWLGGDGEVTGGPGPEGTPVVLTAAVPVEGCSQPDVTALRSMVPPSLGDILGVLRRPRTEPDGLPNAGAADDGTWIPLRAWARDGVHRAGLGRLHAELYLIPGLAPDTDSRRRCAELDAVPRQRPPDRPALCMVLGRAGGPLRTACFSPDQIRSGAAVALDGSTAYGVVPDGVEAVTLRAGGRTVRADVVENVYEAASPAREGETVTVRLDRGRGCAPVIDPRLLQAVPVLRRRPDPGANVPEPVLAALPDGVEDAARIAGGGDGITYWVLPRLESGAGPCGTADRACVIPYAEDGRAFKPVCATAEEIKRDGAFLATPDGDSKIVYGLTRDGVELVQMDIDGVPAGGVRVADGVAAQLFGADPRWHENARVTFHVQPVERGEGTLAVLNGTTEQGLAGRVQGELVERVPELLPAGGANVSNTVTQQLEHSEVRYLAGRKAEAQPIAGALGITRVREVTREELADAGAPGSAVIAVAVGLDFRMR